LDSRWSIYLGFDWPEKLGSIEAGKYADFIVLDRDIFDIPIMELHKTKVEKTITGGRIVFDRQEAINELVITEIKITNKDLDNSIDAAELNLLVEDELMVSSSCGCNNIDSKIYPGARSAPDEVNQAFASLADKGYRFLLPARTIL